VPRYGLKIGTDTDGTGPDGWSFTFTPSALGITSSSGTLLAVAEFSGTVDPNSDGSMAARISGTHGFPDIPTVSEWGLLVMTLLLLSAATIVLLQRRTVTARA
jgi:hypothetical protein